jgi:hypothetical protein
MMTELKTGELGHATGSPLFFSPAKVPVPSSAEIPNSHTLKSGFYFGNFLGIWSLEFGTFFPCHG